MLWKQSTYVIWRSAAAALTKTTSLGRNGELSNLFSCLVATIKANVVGIAETAPAKHASPDIKITPHQADQIRLPATHDVSVLASRFGKGS